MTDLYKLHKENCIEHNRAPLSRQVLADKFEKVNLAFFKPKKDQCDVCVAHEVRNVADEVWAEHRQKKDHAKDEKNGEKEHAIQYWSATRVLGSEDLLQAWTILLSLCLQASALYYKQNLFVHNLTVYNLATHEAMCYVWHEGEGELSSSEFTSCIIDYLEENPEYDVFTLFSEGADIRIKTLSGPTHC